jgi:hypothetical protein
MPPPKSPDPPSPLAKYLAEKGYSSSLHEAMGGTLPASVPLSSLLGQLTNFSKHIEDRFYKNDRIPLDGYTFKNCGFHNCVLSTDSGVFTLEGCALHNCTVEFGPDAVKVIKLWHSSGASSQFPDFNPRRNTDGTITIK